MKTQQGFTLIELIVVIVILGILAATALPKFADFKGDAAQAAVQGVAGAVSSASALNYSKYQINSSSATQLNGADPCDALVKSTKTGLVGAALPSGTAIDTDATCNLKAAGDTVTCILKSTDDTTKKANATIICTG